MSGLDRLDELTGDDAQTALLRCCGSTRWARLMAAARPFGTVEALHRAADEIWRHCQRNDLLEAFAAHPRIGDQETTSEVSKREQSAMQQAQPHIRERLAVANDAYLQRFGYIFLIRATGRTAQDMLEQLEQRLRNDPDAELQIAAEQQRQITALRLDKLLAQLDPT
jgi:OHCU decarboxylase